MTALEDAARRARRLYPRSKGFRRAYLDGAAARLDGHPADRCPYGRDPHKTWGAAWRAAWLGGWNSVAAQASEG